MVDQGEESAALNELESGNTEKFFDANNKATADITTVSMDYTELQTAMKKGETPQLEQLANSPLKEEFPKVTASFKSEATEERTERVEQQSSMKSINMTEVNKELEKAIDAGDTQQVINLILVGADVTSVPKKIREVIWNHEKSVDKKLREKKEKEARELAGRTNGAKTSRGDQKKSIYGTRRNLGGAATDRGPRHKRLEEQQKGDDDGVRVEDSTNTVDEDPEEVRRKARAQRRLQRQQNEKRAQARANAQKAANRDLLDDKEAMQWIRHPVKPMIEYMKLIEVADTVTDFLDKKTAYQRAKRQQRKEQLEEKVRIQREMIQQREEMIKENQKKKLLKAKKLKEEARIARQIDRQNRIELYEEFVASKERERKERRELKRMQEQTDQNMAQFRAHRGSTPARNSTLSLMSTGSERYRFRVSSITRGGKKKNKEEKEHQPKIAEMIDLPCLTMEIGNQLEDEKMAKERQLLRDYDVAMQDMKFAREMRKGMFDKATEQREMAVTEYNRVSTQNNPRAAEWILDDLHHPEDPDMY